jgi:hypothetical protein
MRRLLFAFILFASVCHGQDYYIPPANHNPHAGYSNSRKDTLKKVTSFISFDLGVSIPLREYAEKTTTNNFMIIGTDSTNGKGFANVGFHGSLCSGVFITPSFGACLKIVYNENSFDESSINTMVNGIPNGNYIYSINGSYNIWQFMVGAFGNFQLGRTTSVWIQGMGGFIDANFPSFSIYNLPPNLFIPYLSWNFTLPDATDFAYSLSISFEKGLSQNVSLIGTASYSGAELVYPGISYNFTGPYTNLPSYTQTTPVTMAYGSLDISVGLLFHL